LGQAAAGKPRRGLIIAIPFIATTACLLLIVLLQGKSTVGLGLNQQFLTDLLIIDLITLVYHVWAIADAYLLAGGTITPGRKASSVAPSPARKWGAVAATVLIFGGAVLGHGAFAAADSGWQHDLYCLTAPTPCWITDPGPTPSTDPNATDTFDPNQQVDQVDTPDPGATPSPSGSTGPLATFNASDFPSFAPRDDAEQWAADGQLNVLLIGVGVENNPAAVGPDTVLAVHVELGTGKSMMVGVGRTYTCVPLPASWTHYANAASNGCPAHSFPSQLWNLENTALAHCQYFPILTDTCGQSPDPNKYLRATEVEEIAIGMLLGWPMDGSVTMNPVGLIKLIDDMGGVDINVKSTVTDYPCGPKGTPQAAWRVCDLCPKCAAGNPNKVHFGYEIPEKSLGADQAKAAMNQMAADAGKSGGKQLIRILGAANIQFTVKPGQQHMSGGWALAYARARIYYTEFDRQGRQQEVLKALRKTLNPCDLVSNVGGWLGALKDVPYAFNTDLPITNYQDLQQWASLASRVTGDSVQKLVLTPIVNNNGGNLTINNWASGGYPMIDQNVVSQIRQLQAKGMNASPTAAPSSNGGGGSSC
jgi:hypothetical protein